MQCVRCASVCVGGENVCTAITHRQLGNMGSDFVGWQHHHRGLRCLRGRTGRWYTGGWKERAKKENGGPAHIMRAVWWWCVRERGTPSTPHKTPTPHTLGPAPQPQKAHATHKHSKFFFSEGGNTKAMGATTTTTTTTITKLTQTHPTHARRRLPIIACRRRRRWAAENLARWVCGHR